MIIPTYDTVTGATGKESWREKPIYIKDS